MVPLLSKHPRVICSVRGVKDSEGKWHMIGLHADVAGKRLSYDTITNQWTEGVAPKGRAGRSFIELLKDAPLWAQIVMGGTALWVGSAARKR